MGIWHTDMLIISSFITQLKAHMKHDGHSMGPGLDTEFANKWMCDVESVLDILEPQQYSKLKLKQVKKNHRHGRDSAMWSF